MINNKLFIKTKNSLIRINIIVVTTIMMISSIGIFTYFKTTLYNNIDNEIQLEIKNIINQLPNKNFLLPITIDDPRNLVYIYKYGNIKYFTENPYLRDILPKYENIEKNKYFTYEQNGFTFRSILYNIENYDIHIIRSIESEMDSLKRLFLTLLLSVVTFLILAYFIAIYLTKKALIPIEDAWENQVKFIQDASHEIRTPISIISSKLEMMLKSPNSTINDEVENIADAMSEVRRMRIMVSDLLNLTKLDGSISLDLKHIDINNLLNDIYVYYEEVSQIQEKNININICVNNKIESDESKLKQIIVIFIENAFKYTDKHDVISIYAYEERNYINIEISDTGVGISEKELPQIFNRFFRGEYARKVNIEGSGIGLSIANMLAEWLGIDIEVESKINKGTKFILKIPKHD